MNGGPVLIAAGGTGGHMVPAHALSLELQARGRQVVLLSDERGMKLPGLFHGVDRHLVPAGSPGRGGPLSWPATAFSIWRGRQIAAGLIRELKPGAIAGFGGYPSLPGLWAAAAAGVPILIHEQNAVLGRVNRQFASRAKVIATSYPDVARLDAAFADRVRLVGNPVRPEVLAAPPPSPADERHILVLGGSQGASILSTVVPLALASVRDGRPMHVTQQARADEIAQVRKVYADAGIPADIAPYFVDVPALLAKAELVIARAGASTIAELTACGRPSILVPLPTAMDDHQTANARALAEVGGAVLIPQPEFTAERLGQEVRALTPGRLTTMAEAARAMGHPHAAADLADLIEEISR